MSEALLTPGQVAEVLGVPRSWVFESPRAGRIPAGSAALAARGAKGRGLLHRPDLRMVTRRERSLSERATGEGRTSAWSPEDRRGRAAPRTVDEIPDGPGPYGWDPAEPLADGRWRK
jgi:hypothetical protein